MKQIPETGMDYFERRLTRELAELERQIKSLEAEARALRKQLGKAAAERAGIPGGMRKNSLNRVLVENSILEQLKENSASLPTAMLYRNARTIIPELRENTFRTYLHRMKKRDLIRTAGRAGEWILPPAATL